MTDFLRFLSEFALLCLAAITMENSVFARGFGLSRAVAVVKRPRSLFRYGLLITALTLLGSMVSYLVSLVFPSLPMEWMPLVYLGAMALLYFGCHILNKKISHPYQEGISRYLPVATFNCAVLGSIFLSVQGGFEFWEYVSFGLGTGLGFLLSTLLLVNGMKLMQNKEVPKSFAGLPLMLLFAGILSLAFYSLIGHPLPF